MDKELKKKWDEFVKALVPFKGYIKDFFTDEKLEETEKKIELSKISDEFKAAVEDMIYESKRLKKAAKNLRRKLY